MRHKTMYRLLVFAVFLLLMSVGIYIGSNYVSEDEKSKSEEVSTNKKENVNVYDESQEASSNNEEETEDLEDISVNYVDIYSECGHSVVTTEIEYNTTKEDVINKVNSEDNGYLFVGEQDSVLIFEKTYEGKCHDHYKIVLEDDEIVIYKIGDSGDYEFYQSSGVVRDAIREDLITELTDGIEAYGLEELYIIMEDIES